MANYLRVLQQPDKVTQCERVKWVSIWRHEEQFEYFFRILSCFICYL